ncbi:DinB family protein [Hymenobacter tibetensis]|uniref:DinB family protein n=1 Tax=Hymenobacter tibetensis TaxID=497967 RepID=A0ABY4CVE0_9BACT|nr:DinB family protein [Hymenobacter tibetensis]UOG74240.1 DinB family protein [Hymenobacter tibetensis]
MSESERIADQLRRAFDGDAWSGPSLQQTLANITAAQAAAYPWPGVHTIGELVQHLTTWTVTVAQRVEARQLTPMTRDDWPLFPVVADEAAWLRTRQQLHEAHEQLVAITEALPATELDTVLGDARQRADGSGVSIYVLLHGIVQHYLYHAGQIALLRKFV